MAASGSSASAAASSSTNSGLPSDRSTTLAVDARAPAAAEQGAEQLGHLARAQPAELEVAGARAGSARP